MFYLTFLYYFNFLSCLFFSFVNGKIEKIVGSPCTEQCRQIKRNLQSFFIVVGDLFKIKRRFSFYSYREGNFIVVDCDGVRNWSFDVLSWEWRWRHLVVGSTTTTMFQWNYVTSSQLPSSINLLLSQQTQLVTGVVIQKKW